MDPITALGLASNLVQMIDFSTRLLNESFKVVKSGQDTLEGNQAITQLAEDYRKLSLNFNGSSQASSAETTARHLVQRSDAAVSQLLELLSDLQIEPRPNKVRKVSHVIKQSIKSRLDAEKIESHRKRLHELSVLLSNALLEILRGDQARGFSTVLSKIDEKSSEHGEAICEMHREILAIIRSQRQIRIRRLLDSLNYSQLHHRHGDISPAAIKTFQWIWSSKSPLRRWLKDGKGVFWLCGKAGSGKSTLMKYLQHSNETVALLKEWSGSKSLKVARHYFWYAGSSLQKSHEGLLRHLLYDILRQADGDEIFDLAVKLCPSLLNALESQELDAWSIDELSEALVLLGSIPHTNFCIFVDGLDEYSPQENQVKLVRLIQLLATLPNVKLCVSSRPWHVFERNFGGNGQTLKLEELTFDDMQKNAWQELRENEQYAGFSDDFVRDTDDAKDLVSEIAKKSEGVFLWTTLVVKLLKEEMSAGRQITRLRSCLEEFPQDLYTFFKNLIFGRINWRKRSDTAKTLRLALLLANVHGRGNEHHLYESGRLSFLNFWILAQPDLLDRINTAKEPYLIPLSNDELKIKKRETSAFLSQVCKDLLQVSDYHKDAQSQKSELPYSETTTSRPNRSDRTGLTSETVAPIDTSSELRSSKFPSSDFTLFEETPFFELLPDEEFLDSLFPSFDIFAVEPVPDSVETLANIELMPKLDSESHSNENAGSFVFPAYAEPLLPLSMPRGGNIRRTHILEVNVTFLHRMVFDFLNTDEMETLLDQELPAEWKTSDILNRIDLTRLSLVPVDYDKLCGFMLSCVESTRALWAMEPDQHHDMELALGEVATSHVRALCKPHCPIDRQHCRMALGWASSDVSNARFSAVLEKHPQWSWTSFFEVLAERLTQNGLDKMDLQLWHPGMMAGSASFRNIDPVNILQERFEGNCSVSPQTCTRGDWLRLWEITKDLMAAGLLRTTSGTVSSELSIERFEDAVLKFAPGSKIDEVKEICSRHLRPETRCSAKEIQGKYLIPTQPIICTTLMLYADNVRLTALQRAKQKWLQQQNDGLIRPSNDAIDHWFSKALRDGRIAM